MLITEVQTLESGRMRLSPSRLAQINKEFLEIPINKLAAYGRNPVLTQLIDTENLDEHLASEMPVIDFLCFIRNMQGNSQYRLETDLPDKESEGIPGRMCMYGSIRQYCMLLRKNSSNLTVKLYLYQSVEELFTSLIESSKSHRRVLSDLYHATLASLESYGLNKMSGLGDVLNAMLAYQQSPWDIAVTRLGDYSSHMVKSYALLTQLFLRPFICAYPDKFKADKTILRYLPDFGPDEDDDLFVKRKEQLTWQI